MRLDTNPDYAQLANVTDKRREKNPENNWDKSIKQMTYE